MGQANSLNLSSAMKYGRFDTSQGGHYYWDVEEDIWWTWDTSEMITEKFLSIMESQPLGGVFAWGLGEDGNEFTHLKTLNLEVQKLRKLREERKEKFHNPDEL